MRLVISWNILVRTAAIATFPPPRRIGKEKKNRKTTEDGKEDCPEQSGGKVGGQPGHEGKYLPLTDNPDVTIDLLVPPEALASSGLELFREREPERRQVVDFEIKKVVTEYRAQVLEGVTSGARYTAAFPPDVNAPTQYGNSLRAHAVGLTCRQSVPYERVAEQFEKEYGIPVSTGSMVNWEKLVAKRLSAAFVPWAKANLLSSSFCHFDETGINIAGDLHWAHEANNGKAVLFYAHGRRGKTAMEDFGILPHFRGVSIHDHWHSYFKYTDCSHALCNAHHLRELEKIAEDPAQPWAEDLKTLLVEMRDQKLAHNGIVPPALAEPLEARYDQLLQTGLHKNPGTKKKGKRRSKARCLLDRLHRHKAEVLRFMYNALVPFTNNDAERPIRMLKVEMKISGTFRSLVTAQDSLTIRSYLLTCQNHGISPHHAIKTVLNGQMPDFMSSP
jgi:transposase